MGKPLVIWLNNFAFDNILLMYSYAGKYSSSHVKNASHAWR